MSDKVQAIVLNPTGTYEVQRGELNDKVIVGTDGDGWSTTVERSTVFRRNTPVPFGSLSQVTRDAVMEHKPVFEDGSRWIVKGRNDATPMKFSYFSDEDLQRVQKEAQVAKQGARQQRAAEEAQSAMRIQRMIQIAWIVAIVAAMMGFLIVCIIALAVLPDLFSGFAASESSVLNAGALGAVGAVLTKPRLRRKEDPVTATVDIPQDGEVQITRPPVDSEMEKPEEVLLLHDCYEPGYLFITLPRRELKGLDIRGRYTAPQSWRRWLVYPILTIFGGGVGAVVPLMVFAVQQIMFGGGTYSPLPWAPIGALIMLGWAHKLVRDRKPTPLWVARLMQDGELEPCMTRSMLQDYSTEGNGRRRPQVIRDHVLYQVQQQPHIRRLLRAKQPSQQKVMIGSLIALVSVLALLVIFLGLAMQGN